MNEFILVAMNRKNHTQEERDENSTAAYTAATYAHEYDNDYTADYAAAYAADYAATARDADADYWVNRYFEITGEDKQTYINTLENKS